MQLSGQTSNTQINKKYPEQMLRKMQAYNQRLTAKTEKTLVRLSRWEIRIKKIIEKASPETAHKLFAEGQPTFGTLLEQLREGQAIADRYVQPYNQYMDDVGLNLKYLQNQKEDAAAAYGENKKAVAEWDTLSQTANKTAFIQDFISKRKKQLLQGAMKYAGKTQALKKLNKEAWYYTESLRNYKELFEDAGKREQLAKKVLSGLPAYQKFARENSMLASLFAIPPARGASGNTPSLAGLQTRASVQDMIQQRIASGGPNGMAQVQQNLMEAQGKLSEIKDKIMSGGHIGSDGDVEMPDFKPNSQRSKTFMQRIQYGFDIQFSRQSSLLPSTANLGLNIGYRVSDGATLGTGISYVLGLGNIDNIHLSSEGIGLRSYLDWKIKGQWYVAGGYEMNYRSRFKDMDDLRAAAWQRSGLIGVSRQYKAGKKLKGEVKLLYDFLYKTHTPAGTPLVMRVGYKL